MCVSNFQVIFLYKNFFFFQKTFREQLFFVLKVPEPRAVCGIHQGKKCRIRWYNAPNAESTAIVSEVKVLNVY